MTVADDVFAVLWPPAFAILSAYAIRQPVWRSLALAGGGLLISAALYPPSWAWAVIGSGWLVIALAIWWWRRRKDRRKALALLGAKGKARIAAMVGAMRERARPRVVLRPQRSPA